MPKPILRLRWLLHRAMGGGFDFTAYREWIEWNDDRI